MIAKELYRAFLSVSTKVIGVKRTKKLDAYLRFHRKLDLDNPTTLADKVSWLEINTDNPLKARCTDKYEVRYYIAEKGLEELLVPFCHPVCSRLDEINFDALPNKFAMKATHGCGMNLICDDKSKLDIEDAKKKAALWLKNDYGRACIEPHYKKLPHRLIFEQYLENNEGIIDYKFHCFHGKPDFVLVCSERSTGLKRNLYDLDWNPIDELVVEKGTRAIPKPAGLERMVEISKILSEDFDFVRVDLYEINGKIYFGELTFSPATGVLPSFSEKFLAEKGALLHLKNER